MDILWCKQGIHKEKIDTTFSELPVKRVAHSKPTESTQKSQKNSGGCYVATCVYGSYDCPQVWTLRRFRDFKLSKSLFGRLFIKVYYKISPKIVKLFGNQNWFKVFWKKQLDKWFLSYKKTDMKIHLIMIDNYSFFLKNDRISDQISS